MSKHNNDEQSRRIRWTICVESGGINEKFQYKNDDSYEREQRRRW